MRHSFILHDLSLIAKIRSCIWVDSTITGENIESFIRNHCVIEQKITQNSIKHVTCAKFSVQCTEFIICHASVTLICFACPGKLDKVSRGDFAGHCSIYIQVTKNILYEKVGGI